MANNKSAVVKLNKYENTDRAIALRTWCNAIAGRTSALAKHVFDHCPGKSNSMSHYKYGRHDIKDWMWEKIEAGIKLVEASEKENEPKVTTQLDFKEPSIPQEEIDAVKSYFIKNPADLALFNQVVGRDVALQEFDTNKDIYIEFCKFMSAKSDLSVSDTKTVTIKKWLVNDRSRKMRLANVIYVHNFVDGKDKDYTSTPFTSIIKSIEQNKFTITNFDQVESIMNKVDDMINSNHPFAIAAGRVVEAS